MSRLAIAGIMPLYNNRRTVIEAIESMLTQTRVLDEIVVVDDGATDGSGNLVAHQYGGDKRVRVIRQPNRGVSAARNTGIRETCSSLVAFLDADDKWLPTYIEVQAGMMEENPSCMLSFSAHILCNELNGLSVPEVGTVDKGTYVQRALFREELLPACCGVVVRREALDAVGLFDESLWMGEDIDLWLRIMMRFGFEYIPQPLVWIRRGQKTETLRSMARRFMGNDRYFAKHRYTFGADWQGQKIWRAGYASVLRRNANRCFQHGYGRQGMERLLRSVCIWPFLNPIWTMKSGLEYVMGLEVYAEARAAAREITRILKKVWRRV